MTEKTHWRYRKNLKSARELDELKQKESLLDKKQSNVDENNAPLPCNPSHWRYKKNGKIKKNGTMGMKDVPKATLKKVQEEPDEEEKPVKEVEKTIIYSYEELKDMNLKKQTKMLKKFGEKKIPRYEKQRIELIIKIQDGKN